MLAAVYTGDGQIEVQIGLRTRSPAPARRWSRSRTAGSAAPTCTSCSSSTRDPVRCSATSGRARSSRSVTGADAALVGARVVAEPDAGVRRVPRLPPRSPVGVPAPSSRPTTSTSAARSAGYVVVAGRSPPADPGRALVAGRRAHRTDRDRAAHGERLGRRARRPRADHRRGPGRTAHDSRCSARAASTTSPSSSPHRCAASARAAMGAAHVVEPEALPRAPMGRPVAEPFTVAFECSGHAGAAEAALDQLDYAGTLVFVGTGHELPARQPQPCDRARAHAHRRVQLRRRRLRGARSPCSRRARCRSTI